MFDHFFRSYELLLGSTIIGTILLLTSCQPIYKVNPEVEPYIQKFIKYSEQEKKKVTIINLAVDIKPTSYEKNIKDWLGLCYKYSTPFIVLNKEYWYESNDLLKEELIFHELGHCVLNREHDDTKLFSVPLSLMYPYELKNYYVLLHDYYIHELFWEKK